ncbi:hypothetical protein C5167_042052 [Papaver somniferum]|nr:hypothetical protein C5167_042052 [Papaver somniferum]
MLNEKEKAKAEIHICCFGAGGGGDVGAKGDELFHKKHGIHISGNSVSLPPQRSNKIREDLMENIVMLLSMNSLIISAEFSEYIQVVGGRLVVVVRTRNLRPVVITDGSIVDVVPSSDARRTHVMSQINAQFIYRNEILAKFVDINIYCRICSI